MAQFWAIADTHLSFGKPKDMARFGERWVDHAQRLATAWRASVAADDIVLLPGDLSWADKPTKVIADLEWLTALPGRKVLVRGNHDHWWRNIDEVRKVLEPFGFYALQGDSCTFDGVLVCGAMGYVAPNDPYYEKDTRKDRYERELKRLESALQHAAAQRTPDQPWVVMLHYPPFTSDGQPTPFAEAITQAKPTICLYGHLHRAAEWEVAVNGLYEGVDYRLVAADFIQMMPQRVL
ncbi:MAG: metallophosphoesterase [Aggregatilineales bacterium]